MGRGWGSVQRSPSSCCIYPLALHWHTTFCWCHCTDVLHCHTVCSTGLERFVCSPLTCSLYNGETNAPTPLDAMPSIQPVTLWFLHLTQCCSDHCTYTLNFQGVGLTGQLFSAAPDQSLHTPLHQPIVFAWCQFKRSTIFSRTHPVHHFFEFFLYFLFC